MSALCLSVWSCYIHIRCCLETAVRLSQSQLNEEKLWVYRPKSHLSEQIFVQLRLYTLV